MSGSLRLIKKIRHQWTRRPSVLAYSERSINQVHLLAHWQDLVRQFYRPLTKEELGIMQVGFIRRHKPASSFNFIACALDPFLA
eukprot:gene7025-8379_t